MKTGSTFLAAAIIIGGIYLIERWKWTECRNVGHGVMYCLFSK